MRSYMKERKENRLFYLLNHTEEIVIVAMFALMVAVIFLQVIMRYVFSNSLSWSEELGKFLFVWITWLGISLGERKGEHIKITMLTDRLPFRVAQVVNILSEIIRSLFVPLHFTTESRWCFSPDGNALCGHQDQRFLGLSCGGCRLWADDPAQRMGLWTVAEVSV